MESLNKAKLIGEGEWIKNTAYRVYELDGKYYSVIIVGPMNLEIMESTFKEIAFEEIGKYI